MLISNFFSHQKSTSTKFVNKILNKSTINTTKQRKSTIVAKVEIFSSTNLHFFLVSYLQSTSYTAKKSSTIYKIVTSLIYNLQQK